MYKQVNYSIGTGMIKREVIIQDHLGGSEKEIDTRDMRRPWNLKGG